MRAPRRRLLPRTVLLLAAALATGEVVARIVDGVRGTDSSVVPLPDPAGMSIIPHPYVGWIPRPGHVDDMPGMHGRLTNNSLGFRGPEVGEDKPPGTFRIACIGGSTTQGSPAMRDDRTWPAVLQSLLQQRLPPGSPYERVEVVNGGAGLYTSMESFISLKTRLLPLDLDLVISYDAANDALVIPRVGFRPDYTHARRSWSDPPPRPLPDRLLGWSHLYGMFLDEERRLGPRYIMNRLYVERFSELPFVPVRELGPALETFYWTQR